MAPGPIATVSRWNTLGRRVKWGERAISLCMPVTVKEPSDAVTGVPPEAGRDTRAKTILIWKPRWFALAQTEGEGEPPAIEVPAWDRRREPEALDTREVPFTHLDGNVQGYALGRSIAVSPLAQLPMRTLCHELAHVLLGHSTTTGQDRLDLPKTLTEAEAEAVALLCLEALGLPGAEYARGYIQSWYGRGTALPDASAQRILKAADTILRAGRPKPAAVVGVAA